MKTMLKVVSLTLVAVFMLAMLASCGGPSGKYGTDNYTLNFSGSKITVTYKGLLKTYEMTGKFEMGKDDDGNKTITFTMDETETESLLGDAAFGAAKALFDGTKSYNEGKDDAKGKYVEIGGVKYYELKD